MLAGVAASKMNKNDNRNFFFFRKKWSHPLLTFSQWNNSVVKIISGSKCFICLPIFIFVAFLRLLENQKDDESTLFPGDVSVKFWNDLLGLAKGKRDNTPTHNYI